MDLMIREALESDVTRIAMNNIELAFETEEKEIDMETALKGAEAVLRDDRRGFYLLVECEGRTVGQCLITREWSDWRNGTFWWVQSVFVDKEWRKKGVFSYLFGKLMEKAEGASIIGIRLYVDKGNTSAIQVYESLGLKQTRYSMFEMLSVNDG